MSTASITEEVVEQEALNWFAELGYQILHGGVIAPSEPAAERDHYEEVVLLGRLRAALVGINPGLPREALAEAERLILRRDGTSLVAQNHRTHPMLVDGIAVDVRRRDGSIGGELVRLIDFDHPANNDWLVVNQFTITNGPVNRRPDLIVFVNGLPLGVVELKNPLDLDATIFAALEQLQTYKAQIPALFAYNAALVISDGVEARLGSLTATKERFLPWRTIDGEALAPAGTLQLETLLRGVFERGHLLDLLRSFVVFEDEGGGVLVKKLAGYHQFHAVRTAVASTVAAVSPTGDKRAGVIWHTQGSGKSLTMAFYAGKIVLEPALENPTLVVLTDRNDLDEQLFGTFARCHELLRQTPVQAEDRGDLRAKLQVAAGGVIFTTIQKFLPDARGERYPTLSTRRNIIVIADEAHRSQYGLEAKADTKTGTIDYGFAQHVRDALPQATLIGFTGTPVELADRSTRNVFGEHISVYDIRRAVEDGATVPIYYESRQARLELAERERPRLDPTFEEVTEGEEATRKEQLKSKWAALEALVGAEQRITRLAEDLVAHFERRLEGLDGKAMVVCMSRRICVDLYNAIIALRPDWHAGTDDQGAIKVIMTGSATDGPAWQDHIRNKARREAIARRFKDPADPLKLVIVRDMWLTGFDAPCMHTMYIDKPMRGHGLMQAIARVNRVFKDKPGGLVVDYLGLADQLREAMLNYTQNGGEGEAKLDQAAAVELMLEKRDVCRTLFHGFDYAAWGGTPVQRLALLPTGQEHILAQEDGAKRLAQAVAELSRALALALPDEAALAAREEVAFFQAINTVLAKTPPAEGKKSSDDMDHAVRQLVSRAIISDEVIDIFAAAGLKKPDLSVLSEEFLIEMRGLPQKNLAVEVLRKLLANEIKTRARTSLLQSRSFAAMLERSIQAYQSRAIETVKIIEELIELAREMREAQARGEHLGLSEDELAFYEALEVNDSAVQVLGEPTLKTIARDLVTTVKRNATIDWTVRESVRAQLRVAVKRVLRKHGYPPDKQEKAVQTVLQQAELRASGWAA